LSRKFACTTSKYVRLGDFSRVFRDEQLWVHVRHKNGPKGVWSVGQVIVKESLMSPFKKNKRKKKITKRLAAMPTSSNEK